MVRIEFSFDNLCDKDTENTKPSSTPDTYGIFEEMFDDFGSVGGILDEETMGLNRGLELRKSFRNKNPGRRYFLAKRGGNS